MGQVCVLLNGRTYRFNCRDGEEQRFEAVAAYVRAKLEQMGDVKARPGDDRLLAMLALTIADELLDRPASGSDSPRKARMAKGTENSPVTVPEAEPQARPKP